MIIGDYENPSRLTGCEWLDVFIDQQSEIRVGQHKSGYWMLEAAEAGEYEFEFTPVAQGNRPSTHRTLRGRSGAIPITQASFYLSNYHHLSIGEKVLTGSRRNETGWAQHTSVTFTAKLE